jgi:hypothetical protein
MAEEEIRTRTIDFNNEIKLSIKIKEKLQKLQYRLDRIQIERTVELDIPENENYSKQMF